MLIAKPNRVGIDKAIYDLQLKLNKGFAEYIGLSPTDPKFECYGRAYKNPQMKSGDVSGPTRQEAHVYTTGNDYKRITVDDRLYASCFFGMGDKIDITEEGQADVHLVFFVNLKKCFPTSTQRMDEEVRLKVLDLLKAGTVTSPVQSVELTPLKVLREYNAEYESRADWHPFHLFRVNLRVRFDTVVPPCRPFSNIN